MCVCFVFYHKKRKSNVCVCVFCPSHGSFTKLKLCSLHDNQVNYWWFCRFFFWGNNLNICNQINVENKLNKATAVTCWYENRTQLLSCLTFNTIRIFNKRCRLSYWLIGDNYIQFNYNHNVKLITSANDSNSSLCDSYFWTSRVAMMMVFIIITIF